MCALTANRKGTSFQMSCCLLQHLITCSVINRKLDGDLRDLYDSHHAVPGQVLVVEPEDTDALAVEEGEDLVTLLTCTPYGVNTQRLLVRGHRVDYVADEVAAEQTPLSGISLHTNYLLWVIVGILITGVFILILFIREKRFRKKAAREKEAEE